MRIWLASLPWSTAKSLDDALLEATSGSAPNEARFPPLESSVSVKTSPVLISWFERPLAF